MQQARITLAKSPPGTTVGGWQLIPHLNPVGDQSTNWMVRFVLIVATAAFTSFGTTSPRYIMQHAMYLPWRGSHFTIMHAGSNTLLVISATLSCSWYAFSAEVAVQVRVRRALDIQITAADIIESFVVDLVSDIRMFQERVNAQHRVVRLDARRGDLRARPHRERDFR